TYSIGLNYPNPFNSTTIIPLNVRHTSDIQILIFNVNGQLMDNLFQGRLQPGNYDFCWKPTALLPSGIYFYQIVKGNNMPVTKKMLFLK
ncbi:MAG: T9SS type A sorting domain-containing protein, partial [Candidatus Marinimicrobia bacterium]|nr:T9SS type A sorting domain-containing protein [Candidatus Neomarinimicrobiota bacterium]